MQPIISIILLLWSGMILGISCLEAWAKFKTPSLSKAVGLDVGRTVFRAFHRLQWGLFIFLVLMVLFLQAPAYALLIFLGILLSCQSFWVFPHLCAQVDMYFNNETPSKNYYHVLYACLELVKLFLLLSSGIYFVFT